MGFEISYEYKNSDQENAEYQSTKMRVGKPTEDTPLEELAGRVMSIFAKRNCDVKNIEIYEYTKKKVNFRESDDGIFLKNRKFKFGHGPAITNDMDKGQLLKMITSDPELVKELKKLILPGNEQRQAKQVLQTHQTEEEAPQSHHPAGVAHLHEARKPIRYEIFNPDEFFRKAAENMKFKIGNKYPIFEEKMAPNPQMGMLYLVKNSDGEMQRISDRFFTPEIRMTHQDPEDSVLGNGSSKKGGPRLSHQDSTGSDMLVLRR